MEDANRIETGSEYYDTIESGYYQIVNDVLDQKMIDFANDTQKIFIQMLQAYIAGFSNVSEYEQHLIKSKGHNDQENQDK